MCSNSLQGGHGDIDVSGYRRLLTESYPGIPTPIAEILAASGIQDALRLGHGTPEAWRAALSRFAVDAERPDAAKTRQEGLVASWIHAD